MSAIILFRFHTDLELCRERLKILRHLNPSLGIYGLYGGSTTEFDGACRALSPWLDGLWVITGREDQWKWLHQDLMVREWFAGYGHRLPFDCLYDYEYDLLLAAPLEQLLPRIAGRQVAFSGLKRLSEVRATWYWTSVEPFAQGFERYARFMRARYGFEAQTYVTQGPFPVLPRTFLEQLCDAELPAAVFNGVNCETSYPGLAEALGFGVIDTRLHPGWTAAIPSRSASELFHCERQPLVSAEHIGRELKDPRGRRAFHPVKDCIRCEWLLPQLGAARK
jgi:hypothetical protein